MALAIQLLHILRPFIPDRVVETYQDEMVRHAGYLRMPSVLTEVIQQLLNQCPLVYLVVDGLDECQEDENLPRVRKLLTDIVSASTYGTAKWFFTSRPDIEIGEMMNKLQATTLSPSVPVLAAEIKMFLADGLHHIPSAMERIDCRVDYSEGSFLYAKFLLDTLLGKGVTCHDDIKRALREFPKDLTGYYIRSLLKLCERSIAEQHLVK